MRKYSLSAGTNTSDCIHHSELHKDYLLLIEVGWKEEEEMMIMKFLKGKSIFTNGMAL